MSHEAAAALAIAAPFQRHTRRRLSAKILIAFHQARDQAEFEVAELLPEHRGHNGKRYAATARAARQ